MSDPREIGINDARGILGDLVDRARIAGETTYLTKHGKRAAAVVPMDRADVPERIAAGTRTETLREAIEAASGEYLTDNTGSDEDAAYNQGIADAIAAITALLDNEDQT